MKESMACNIPRNAPPNHESCMVRAGLAPRRGRSQTKAMNALLETYSLPMMAVVLIGMLIWAAYDSIKN